MRRGMLWRASGARHVPVPLSPAEGRERQGEVETFLGKVVVAYLIAATLATVGTVVFVMSLPHQPGWAPLIASSWLLLAVNTGLMGAAIRGHHLFASVGVFFVGTTAVVGMSVAVLSDADAHLLIIGLLFAGFLLLGPDQQWVRWVMGLFGLGGFLVVEFLVAPGSALFPIEPSTNDVVQSVIRVSMAAHIAIDVALMQYRFAAGRAILVGIAGFAELRATTDELTGLVNRRPVMDRLEQWAGDGDGGYTVAVVDVDEFKSINDALGHDCGDALIQDVAATMRRVFRQGDLVSRWGGDEFLVLMEGVRPQDSEAILERLRASVAGQARSCDGQEFSATVSIGAAICVSGQSPDAVITAADRALYRAKKAGRNRVVVLEDEASSAADPIDYQN